jgi:hypothetical protein
VRLVSIATSAGEKMVRWQQGTLVSPQQRDHYCGASAEYTINAMNTSTDTDQIQDEARAGIGSLRRSMAGALLATTISATAVGLTPPNYPDGSPPRGANTATAVSAPAAPALRWLKGFIDRAFDQHAGCDYRFDDRFPCYWR